LVPGVVQEDAPMRGPGQTDPGLILALDRDLAGVARPEFLHRQTEMIGQPGDIEVAQPDVTVAPAARSAARAAELDSLVIPGLRRPFSFHGHSAVSGAQPGFRSTVRGAHRATRARGAARARRDGPRPIRAPGSAGPSG